jgi:hypothetical protein
MTSAKTLMLDLLAVIPDGEKAATFFAEDGVFEIPFLHAIGIPTRYQGHAAIREFFNYLGGTLYPDFGFKPEDIKVLIDTRAGLRRVHGPHEGGTYRACSPSLVRRATCRQQGQDHASPRIAQHCRGGAGAEPERRRRPPAAGKRNLLRSTQLSGLS